MNKHVPYISFISLSLSLSMQQMAELELIRRQMLDVPLLFAIISQDFMSVSRKHSGPDTHSFGGSSSVKTIIEDQLCKLGYLKDVTEQSQSHMPSPSAINPHDNPDLNPELGFSFVPVDTIVTNFLDFTPELLGFVQCNMRQQITSAASSLHDAHARCLQTLILYAHDLARDVLVTPKRIQYSRSKEEELYTQLIDLASKKQSEIKELVHQAIADVTDQIIHEICQMNFEGVELDSSMQVPDTKSAKKCVHQIQEVVFRELSKQISDRLVSSVNLLRESVVGTLQRCLEKLEESATIEERVVGEGMYFSVCVSLSVEELLP